MSTLNEIYFNYNKAISQAQELEGISKRLKTAANDTMEDILNDVHAAWKSDSTPLYIKKGRKVEDDIRTTATNLANISQAIRTIAQRIRDAELDAWRIANERK